MNVSFPGIICLGGSIIYGILSYISQKDIGFSTAMGLFSCALFVGFVQFHLMEKVNGI